MKQKVATLVMSLITFVLLLIIILSLGQQPKTEYIHTVIPGPTVTVTKTMRPPAVVKVKQLPKSCLQVVATVAQMNAVLDSGDAHLGKLTDDIQSNMEGKGEGVSVPQLNKLQQALWDDRDKYSTDVAHFSELLTAYKQQLATCQHDEGK